DVDPGRGGLSHASRSRRRRDVPRTEVFETSCDHGAFSGRIARAVTLGSALAPRRASGAYCGMVRQIFAGHRERGIQRRCAERCHSQDTGVGDFVLRRPIWAGIYSGEKAEPLYRCRLLQMISLLTIIALGFVLGMRHATDPDHVIAVSTIVSRE